MVKLSKFEEIVKNENLYTFPVYQQDSIVLSQELSSDLSSTIQVLMSKNLQIGDELVKKYFFKSSTKFKSNKGITIVVKNTSRNMILQSRTSKFVVWI